MGKDPEHTHEEDLDETSDDAALAAALAAAQGDAEVWEGGDGGREVEIEKDEVDSQRCPHIHQASPDKIKGKIFMTCVVWNSTFYPLLIFLFFSFVFYFV